MRFPEKKVMYLSAEVPALSATFVYNEIFQFEKQICSVEIASVHRPAAPASDVVDRLNERVTYLYGRPPFKILTSLLKVCFRHPLRFLYALFCLTKDVFSLGIVSRTAVGVGFRFTYGAVLAEELERKGIDHLHVHFAHVPGDIAMYASLMTGIPFSITGHANDIYERGWLLKQKTLRSKFFATISEFNRRALIEKKCPADKLEVVRCGIDESDFSYRSPDTENKKFLKIGSLGRLVPKKGFQTLLGACAQIQDSNIDFVAEIAGDGPLKNDLQDYVQRHELANHVKLLGALPHSEVSTWMSGLDVFVLACCEDENGDVDGIPVVLMEAMAIGVPVITTDVSGLPELVARDKTGLIFSQLDSADLAGQLLRLAGNPDLMQSLSTEAKQRIDQEFTIEANVAKLGKLIFDD